MEFKKSSFSEPNGGNCVEVAVGTASGSRYVRDSKFPHDDLLEFTPSEWSAFIAGVKAGEFD